MTNSFLNVQAVYFRTRLIALNGQPFEQLSIGVKTAANHVFWGDAPFVDHVNPNTVEIIEQTVAPFLTGRGFNSWLDVSEAVRNLRQPVKKEINKEVPVERPAVSSPSRRQILRGLQAAKPQMIRETTIQEHRLPPEIIWGLDIALLKAAAHHAGQEPADHFRVTFDLPLKQPRPALGIPPETAASNYLFDALDHVVVTVDPHSSTRQFGANAEKLQRYVRQLGKWIEKMSSRQPQRQIVLVVDLQGVLGEIYGEKLGRTLGAISGLEGAVKPLPLILVDPIIVPGEPDKTAHQLETLRDYLRLRKLNSDLRQSYHPGILESGVLHWASAGGPAGLGHIKDTPFDFIPPAGLDRDDQNLLGEILDILPLRSLWLPDVVETAIYFVNRRAGLSAV